MKKINILLSAALMFLGLTAKAQTTITFDTEDYAGISVYDKWEESPFRTGELTGNAGVVLNPSTTPDEVLGIAPNSTEKVVGFQRSRYASNAYGVRIDLKEPIRVTKNLQYIHVMTYLKDKPAASRMMVMGLGKRIEASWSGQRNDEVEQFWALTPANVQPKDGWQDIVVSFKGFSYSKEENENSGIDIYALVIVPDLRTPDEDDADWVAYFDEIVVDSNPDKRFSTEQYALTYDQEAAMNRTDRALNKVGVTSNGKTYESNARSQKFYSNNTANSVFSAKAGAEVQPTFGYKGGWMSGYVYVDWGNDALFNDGINANGTPATESDVVSYSALQIGNTWYKSDGSTRGDGNAIGAGVPKFTVPAGTAPGFYRMRYKVDWNSINPAGATDIISNGGGIVDVTLDVHGDEVAVNASQLNGDIVVAADGSDLINYVTGYEQPLKVKIVPAPGFVQYGFTLKYGYNVAAKEQLDDKGNPNWVEVKVPYSEIAADSTYTIPAEYMRGSQVSIEGDMQQVQQYTVAVEGLEGRGGAVYANIETLAGGTVNATQYFTADQIAAIAVEGYTAEVTLNDRLITITYTLSAAPVVVTSILENKLYTLKCRSANAHHTTSFIGISEDGKINGQSAEATFIKFEKANVQNGWYIKIVDANKYLNHNGSNISASAEKTTVWTLGVPTHTANVVTFTIGNDKYLNNNGSDCADNTCANLKANTHNGGPGSGNACSLWEMTQYPEPEDETPVVVTAINNNKVYTLECRSGYAHSAERFIGVTADGKISGQSSTAAYIQFEPASTANGYYIKVVAANKYLNHNGSNISASAEKTTVWTLGVPTHTAGVVTFTIGNDKYLNNNGSDCNDNTCANLKANSHAGGPGSGNACSLWEMTEYSAKVLEPSEPETPEDPDEEAGHTAAAKDLNIYFNPCGVAGSNYITIAKVYGEGAVNPVVYKATAKPASWHVVYSHDYGQVVRGGTFNIDLTLSASAAADIKANAYFDWDANGVFETTVPIALNGADGTANVTVPADAATTKPVRMRVRINSSGLDLSEDDVMGFAYDFHISVVEPQQGFTAKASTSAASRGAATLSSNADSYEAGAELTAIATPANGATFVCWKEEGVVVSTDAQYTFTVDHNVNLKAYFTPAINYGDRMDYVVGKAEGIQAGDKVGEYSQAGVAALASDIAAAKAISVPTQADIDALQAAINNISVNMPSPAKLYKIVKPGAANSVAYAGVNNSCSWGENTTPASVWVFEKGSADNKFYLRNLSTGSYTTSYNKDATVVLGEKNQEVTIVYHGANRQMGIAPNGGEQLNRASNRLCAWTDNPGLNSNSAWIIEEVEDIAHALNISDAGWATLMLGFDAVIPEGVNAHIVTAVNDAKSSAQLTEVKGVLPANTAILVNAEEVGEYEFAYTTATPAAIEDNMLAGTLYNKYVGGEAYVLSVVNDEVGLYKAALNSNAQGGEGTTHFLNNANKAYLALPAASKVMFYSFNIGGGTTAIDEIVANKETSNLTYDLTGRRVEKAEKGIYIVNGKKILVK